MYITIVDSLWAFNLLWDDWNIKKYFFVPLNLSVPFHYSTPSPEYWLIKGSGLAVSQFLIYFSWFYTLLSWRDITPKTKLCAKGHSVTVKADLSYKSIYKTVMRLVCTFAWCLYYLYALFKWSLPLNLYNFWYVF